MYDQEPLKNTLPHSSGLHYRVAKSLELGQSYYFFGDKLFRSLEVSSLNHVPNAKSAFIVRVGFDNIAEADFLSKQGCADHLVFRPAYWRCIKGLSLVHHFD